VTVYATRSPYWLQVGGKWVQLEGIAPEVSVGISRPTVTLTTLGNTVYVQQAIRANRVWSVSFSQADAEAGKWLDYAATNPGAVYLLDRNAAQQNMLDPRETKGSSATTVVVDNGPSMPAFLTTEGFVQKVRGNVPLLLSYTTSRAAGGNVGTYDLGSGPVTFNAPAGSGARRGSVAITPAADGNLTVAWTQASVTTAARLTEGSVDGFGFIEGRTTPCQVMVSDVSANYLRASSTTSPIADQAYTFQEVG
jgi:hypothetical protein